MSPNPRTPALARPRLRRHGMTLIEVATVLLIISLTVGVAVPAFRSLTHEDDLTAASRRVRTLFRLARDSAVSSGLPVTVIIDSVTQRVWLDSPNRHRLASRAIVESNPSLFADELEMGIPLVGTGVREVLEPGSPLGLPSTVDMELPRARARFYFEPSGTVLADSLLLTGAFGVRAVTLDPWTGDVTIRQ